MTDLFHQKAPQYMNWLIRDFGLTKQQAAGILGNIGRECAGFKILREIGAAPGQGGYGIVQWTGARAHTFLNYCTAHGLDWRSDAGNYAYLRQELKTGYASVITALRKTKTVEAATEIFEKQYERAGVPAMSDRIRWARLALAAHG